MKLWVDDIREPPTGWDWAKSSEDALVMLLVNLNHVTELSLDHDLGGHDTTRRVVTWMIEHDYPWPATVRVHTANPIGRQWLEGTVQSYSPQGTLKRW